MIDLQLWGRQDSALFSETSEDNAVKGEMEGGYRVTRPRSTRKAIKSFTTGFSDLSDQEKNIFMAFYNNVETYSSFKWVHPTSNVIFTVRFDKPISAKYIGRGGFHFWSITGIVLLQV